MRPLSALVALSALTRVTHALTSTLAPVESFKAASAEVSMYIYVPQTETTASGAQAIIVAIHSCERTADYYFQNTGYATLADQLGFAVIYPNNSSPSGCWDTSTTASLTRGGGGDSEDIVNMVKYAVKNFNGNASQVAVTGSSSGGLMVNLLAGIYPDVFQAASVYSGEYVNSIAPYSGSRPKMMIYHGTDDQTYSYSNLATELAGWSSVLGVPFKENITDTPAPNYTEMMYGDGLKLVGVSAAGVGHTVPVNATEDLAWFCISPACGADGRPIVSSTSTSTSSTASSSSAPSGSSSLTNGQATTTPASSSDAGSKTSASGTSSPTSSSGAAGSSGLSSDARIGIYAAAGAGALILLAIALCCIRKKRKTGKFEPDHKMIPLEPDGHEYHSGYGVVSINDAKQARGIEKYQTGMNASSTDLLARSRSPGEQHRDNTVAGLFPPRSPGAESPTGYPGEYHRDNTVAGLFPRRSPGTEYPTGYPGEYHRDSNASSWVPPRSPGGDYPRNSSTSSMLYPPPSLAEDARYSVTSQTMLLHGPQSPQEQDISDSHSPFKR